MANAVQRQIMAGRLRDAVRTLNYILVHADNLTSNQRTQVQDAQQTLRQLQLAMWTLETRVSSVLRG